MEQLLLWANSQSGKLSFIIKKVSFLNILNESIELLKLQASTKGITINVCTESDIEIFVDFDMFNVIIRNLISNAIKYSYNNSIINIFAEIVQNQTIISIEDFGVGIDKATISNLFNVSEMKSTKGIHEEKGSGFGLLLCKELIERHGGKIWVDSDPERSTVFSFSIPNK